MNFKFGHFLRLTVAVAASSAFAAETTPNLPPEEAVVRALRAAPMVQAARGQILITSYSMADTAVRRGESFVKGTGATLS